MQIQEALDKFIQQLTADGRSVHTVRQYQRHIRAMARWLEQDGRGVEVEEIGHEDIARFLSSPAARRRPDGGVKKASSVNALRSSVKVFFSYVHAAGYVTENPARLIRRALCGKPPPRWLTRADQERLLAVMAKGTRPHDVRDRMLFGLMLATGIRLGSALALDIEEVDLDRGEFLLRQAKGDRVERVFLGRAIRDALRSYIGERVSGPLFRSHGDRRLSSRQAQKRFASWLQIAGVRQPATTHSLRHSFATRLYQETRDIFLVKEALRHRSIASTIVYARVEESALRKAVDHLVGRPCQFRKVTAQCRSP